MGNLLEKLFGKKKKKEQQISNDNNTVNNKDNTNNNNANQNNNDNLQPITFNQNIDTEIKPINSLGFEPLAPTNNLQPNLNVTESVQNQQQPMVNNPMNNPTPENMTFNEIQTPSVEQPVQVLNVIPGMQNISSVENNNTNNLVNKEAPLQPTTNLGINNSQLELNTIQVMSNPVQEQPTVIQQQPVETPSIMNNTQNQQPITFDGQSQNPTHLQGLNVIPTMGPTPNPTASNQNIGNNQNM